MIGIRDDDDCLAELQSLGIATWEVARLRAEGTSNALKLLERDGLDGFWIHLDADVLNPDLMPAVDSPDPGGIDHDELVALLAPLLASPRCIGLDVTVFDPDLDPRRAVRTGIH